MLKILKVKECIENLKKSAGEGLLTTSIVNLLDKQSIMSYNGDSKKDALTSQLCEFTNQVCDKMGCALNEWFIIDLEGNNMALVVVVENYCWYGVFNKTKVQLGMMLNVIMPEAIEQFKGCL